MSDGAPGGHLRVCAPGEELILAVARVSEVGSVVGSSKLASPSLMTVAEPQEANSGLSLLLRRRDNEVALGHGDFLQEMEEFKGLPTGERHRTLENDIFPCLQVFM